MHQLKCLLAQGNVELLGFVKFVGNHVGRLLEYYRIGFLKAFLVAAGVDYRNGM